MSETQKLLLTTFVTITLALIGYLITYFNSLRLSHLAERLTRVNRQLAEFYGPLFALTQASDSAWDAFRAKYRPDAEAYFDDTELTDAELQAWRNWMKSVFAPTNRRLYECILSKSDLLIESEMPQCLLDLCAHVTSYEPVLKAWEDGDYSEHVALLNYPKDIVEYARSSFQKLKTRQAQLMGHSGSNQI